MPAASITANAIACTNEGRYPLRIGIVGTENSHADHYVRLFNVDRRFGDHRVTALTGGETDRNRELAATGAIEAIHATPEELVGAVDAAIVCSRDGGNHPAEAGPLLRAAIPVMVDKPLACTVEGATQILEAAREGGVPVTSYSALRFAPELQAFTGTPDLVFCSGPADPASEYGGIFFYGIHVAEIALELAGRRPVTDIRVAHTESAVSIEARAGSIRVLLECEKPGSRPDTAWRVRTSTASGLQAADIRLGPHYVDPAVETFVTMLDTGRAPLSEAELLAPVELLSTVDTALRTP